MHSVECVIVGGGPAGLTAALYLARFRGSVIVIDSGTSRARLIGRSHNCPGFVHGVSGSDYLATLHSQIAQYAIELRAETVAKIERDSTGPGFIVMTDRGRLATSQVLLATGIRDVHPPIAEHDDAVRDAVVRYCPVCDGYEASGHSICVIGPAEQALSKARFLRTLADRITLAVLDRDLTIDEAQEMTHLGVTIERATRDELHRDGTTVLVPFADGRRQGFDMVYPAMGAETAATLIDGLGVHTDEQGLIVIDDKNRTNVAGIFAAGDAVTDLHQIAVAVGHAAIAATAIHNTLRP